MPRRIGSTLSIFLHTAAFASCFQAVLLGEIDLRDMLLRLTTVVSLEAIYNGLFLQNSSNRHGDSNEHQAAEDFRRPARGSVAGGGTDADELPHGVLHPPEFVISR